MNRDDVWRQHASCKDADADFFPERGDSSIEAQRVCASCPVQWDCMNHSLMLPERVGIWAGTGWDRRKHFRRLMEVCPHPDRGASEVCSCFFCAEITVWFERLSVIAVTGRGPSPARPTFGPGARHGTKSSYKRGCAGDDCRRAMGMKPRGVACPPTSEEKAG